MSGQYQASVLRLAAGFFFVFMAFNTTQALLTTVLKQKGLTQLAFIALGVIYGTFTATTIVAPKIVSLLGPRLSIFFGSVPYVAMVFANMAPSWYTLLPASVGVGLGAGVLWTGQGIYMSRCAIREAAASGEPVDTVTGRFNGLFWTAFQFNGAVGLIISGLLAQTNVPYYYLFLGFGAVGLAGIAILFTLRPAPPVGGGGGGGSVNGDEEHERARLTAGGEGGAGEKQQQQQDISLAETLRLLGSSRAIQLLLPAIFFCGCSLGFSGGTFPLLYQDDDGSDGDGTLRLLSSKMVGYQAATFYLVNSAASFAWGRLQGVLSRQRLFALSGVLMGCYLGLVIAMATGALLPAHDSVAAYALVFGATACFGVADSVLESQLPAIVQSPSVFPRERDRDAANSNIRMAQSLGYALQYGVGSIGAAFGPLRQAYLLLPLAALAYGGVWACNSFVVKIDGSGAAGGAGGSGKGHSGSDDFDDDAGAGGKRGGWARGASTPLTADEA